MRRLVFVLIGLGLVVVVGIGLTQTESKDDPDAAPTLAAQRRALEGAPAPLAALYARGNQLLPSSPRAFDGELRKLRGRPVVVNAWASWCGPCKFEFPFFADALAAHGRKVAFVGINAGDNRGDAQRFLRQEPIAYPSFEDPQFKITFSLKAPRGLPYTFFFDRRGKLDYVHQGAYLTRGKLEEDIRRYALQAT